MTAPVPIVGYQQVSSYTALQDRQILAARMSATSGNGPAHGVIYSSSGAKAFDVTVQSGTMNINVDSGGAMVQGYSVAVPAGTTTLTVAPSTAVARRDLVILRVYDTEAGDAQSKGAIELVKGSAAGVDPALPARSLLLAQVDVAANATTVTVADRRSMCSPSGANTLVSDRTNAAAIASVGLGELAFQWPTDKLYLRRSYEFMPIDRPAELPSGGSLIKGSIANGDRIYVLAGTWILVPNQAGDISIPLPYQKALLYAHAELNSVPADNQWRRLELNGAWTSPQSVAFRMYMGATYTPQVGGTFGLSAIFVGS